MNALRIPRLTARLVLAWFVMFVAVAGISPLIAPQAMELICSASGGMKLIDKTADGSGQQLQHTLDCSLCANLGSAPPTPFHSHAAPADSLSHALRPVVAAHIAWLTAAPPPARGPPAFS
jgi:hypothetical protein